MIRLAAGVAALGFVAGASGAGALWNNLHTQMVAASANLSRDQSLVDHDNDVIANASKIRHAYLESRAAHPPTTKIALLHALERIHGVNIVRLNVGQSGKTFSCSLSGTYPSLIAATVQIPTRVSGAVVEQLDLGSGLHGDTVGDIRGEIEQ
jgi:hypothetical protein